MLFAYLVAELAKLPVGALVAAVAVKVHEVDSIEDDVIVSMTFVDVGGDHILILALEPFIGKLFADLMRLFR